MTPENARRIIQNNYSMNEGSLSFLLYDECVFSVEAFWDFYNAISVVTLADIKDTALGTQISIAYQRFLKEIICHFDPRDVAVMKGFPENHYSYIERLDCAVRAYLENKPDLLDDNLFELQRIP